MGDNTKISWATLGLDKGATWNPIAAYGPDGKRGWACVKIDDACKFCYAATLNQNRRFGNGLDYTVQDMQKSRLELVNPDQPLRWKKPRGIFVCSMTDLFGEFVPPSFTSKIFSTITNARQHRYAILTKRFALMEAWLQTRSHYERVFLMQPNIWWGMTVGHQKVADEALPYMRKMREFLGPNAILWVSYEPAIGPVDWKGWEFINWLVIGGESGSEARPFHMEDGYGAIDWAQKNGVAAYFKQMGSNPYFAGGKQKFTGKGDKPEEWPDWLSCQQFPASPPSMEKTT